MNIHSHNHRHPGSAHHHRHHGHSLMNNLAERFESIRDHRTHQGDHCQQQAPEQVVDCWTPCEQSSDHHNCDPGFTPPASSGWGQGLFSPPTRGWGGFNPGFVPPASPGWVNSDPGFTPPVVRDHRNQPATGPVVRDHRSHPATGPVVRDHRSHPVSGPVIRDHR